MLVMPWTGGGSIPGAGGGGGGGGTTTLSDDFSTNTTASYSAVTGSGLTISSGYATMGADEWNYAGMVNNTALSSSDHYIDLTAEELSTGTVNAIVRSNGVTGYVLQIYYDGSTVNLESFSGDTTTYAGTFAGALGYAEGFHRFRLECLGDVFTLKHWNGSSFDTLGTVTDSTYTSGNQIGMWWRNNGSIPRADSFTAGTL